MSISIATMGKFSPPQEISTSTTYSTGGGGGGGYERRKPVVRINRIRWSKNNPIIISVRKKDNDRDQN